MYKSSFAREVAEDSRHSSLGPPDDVMFGQRAVQYRSVRQRVVCALAVCPIGQWSNSCCSCCLVASSPF